jgi:hypothetical protein
MHLASTVVMERQSQHNGEPRILDIRLADLLRFERPRLIRELIERNRAELEQHGILPYGTAKSRSGRSCLEGAYDSVPAGPRPR